jgi:hypothetical protein
MAARVSVLHFMAGAAEAEAGAENLRAASFSAPFSPAKEAAEMMAEKVRMVARAFILFSGEQPVVAASCM